jgi:hypothetical protein
MKKSKRSSKSKKQRSFNPNVIAIELREALKRDLESPIKNMSSVPQVASFFKDVQIDKFLSKFSPSDVDSGPLEREAFAKFLRTNDHMALVNRHFLSGNSSPVAIDTGSPYDLDLVLRRAKALCYFVLTPLTEDEWFLGCKTSGGTSIGVPYSNTSPERKFTYPISVSDKKLAPLWSRYCLFDPEFAKSIDQLNCNARLGEKFTEVGASRATTVEKSVDSRRMIAVEPVVNMFFQQGLMDALIRRLEAVGLDVTNVPEKHRQIAFESSVTASYDTIDFASASDCVSLQFLRWLIPPAWFFAINLVRCPSMSIGGTVHELEMISTMGNATTFPIETLVFWSIAVSSVMTVSEPEHKSCIPSQEYFDTCSVFGDDCILPAKATSVFMDAATAVGFLINTEKSFFNGGNFRESCGGDFLHGYNVRPFYLKAPTSNKHSALEPWMYTILNGITKKYISYFGSTSYVYDKEIYRTLFAVFRKERLLVKVVPDWFPDDSGFRIGAEVHRFQSAYKIPFAKVSQSDQGLYRFSYCRFQYRHKEEWFDHVRYAMLQKQNVKDVRLWLDGLDVLRNLQLKIYRYDMPVWRRRIKHLYNIRRLGGYVVATGYTPSWSPNFRGPQA